MKLIGSGFLQLNWKDLGKGVALTIITTILFAVSQAVNGCAECTPPIEAHFPSLDELKAAASLAWIAGVSYLVKNFLTNSQDKMLKAEPKTFR
jgi:hypothetical protein